MEEAVNVGSFIGQKFVVNEFVAYLDFMPYLNEASGLIMSEKSKAIVSFALCGFANLSSIAILLGGLGGIAPSRRAEIARFGLFSCCCRNFFKSYECYDCWFIFVNLNTRKIMVKVKVFETPEDSMRPSVEAPITDSSVSRCS